MKKLALQISFFFASGLLMMGCGSDGGSACDMGQVECDGVCIDAVAPTLSSIQTGVFAVSCTASPCHDAESPAENLDLSSLGASEANLIDVDSEQVDGKRVTPGDSGASYLMNKLLGNDIAFGTTRMPQLDPDGLCTPNIDVIRQWIDDGAPIN